MTASRVACLLLALLLAAWSCEAMERAPKTGSKAASSSSSSSKPPKLAREDSKGKGRWPERADEDESEPSTDTDTDDEYEMRRLRRRAQSSPASSSSVADAEQDGPAEKLKHRVYVGIEKNQLTARSAMPNAQPLPLQCHDRAMLAAFLQALHDHPPATPFVGPRVMSSTMAWDGKYQAKADDVQVPDIDPRVRELRYLRPDIAIRTGQSFWKLFTDRKQPGGIPHYFVAHAAPFVNARGEVTEHTCYHLYMDYSGLTPEHLARDWDRIKDTVEVRTGCAIYKTKAQRMQRFVKCIQPILRQIPNGNPESRQLGNFFLGVRQHVGLTVSYNQFTAGNLEPQIAHWARYAHKARSFDEWIARVLGPEDQRITAEMSTYKRVEWGLLNKWDRSYNADADAGFLPLLDKAPKSTAKLDFSTYWQRIRKDVGGEVQLHSNAALADRGRYTPLLAHAQQQEDYTELREQAKRCFDVEGSAEEKVELMDAFRCLPAMYGAPGVLSNGVGNHDHTWFQVAYGQIEAEVPMHPTCARLASEQLAHFGGLDYAEGFAETMNKLWTEKVCIRGLHTWSKCVNRNVNGGGLSQCGLYPACYKLAACRVCAAEPACCPTAAVARACREDPEGKDCRRGMHVATAGHVMFDASLPEHAEHLSKRVTSRYSEAVQALEVPPLTPDELRSIGVDPNDRPMFFRPMALSQEAVDAWLDADSLRRSGSSSSSRSLSLSRSSSFGDLLGGVAGPSSSPQRPPPLALPTDQSPRPGAHSPARLGSGSPSSSSPSSSTPSSPTSSSLSSSTSGLSDSSSSTSGLASPKKERAQRTEKKGVPKRRTEKK